MGEKNPSDWEILFDSIIALSSEHKNFIEIIENGLSYQVFVSTEFQMSHTNRWFYALLNAHCVWTQNTESRPRVLLHVTVQHLCTV